MKSRSRLIFVSIFVLLACGCGWAYHQWRVSPEYSLLQIKSAYDTHDVVLFEKHVDLETIISRAIDVIMDDAMSGTAKSNGAAAIGGALAAGIVAFVKPKLIKQASEQVRMEIEGRSIAATEAVGDEKETGVSADRLFSLLGSSEAPIRRGDIRRDGHTAFVTISRYSDDLQADVDAEFKMRDMGGYWQIVEFSNLQTILARQKQLLESRLLQVNQPIRAELSASVAISELKKIGLKKGWQQIIEIHGKVTNLTDIKIDSANFQIEIKNQEMTLVKTVMLGIKDLPRKAEEVRHWELDTNMFSTEDQALFDLPDNFAVFVAEPVEVVFSNGRAIELVNSL